MSGAVRRSRSPRSRKKSRTPSGSPARSSGTLQNPTASPAARSTRAAPKKLSGSARALRSPRACATRSPGGARTAASPTAQPVERRAHHHRLSQSPHSGRRRRRAVSRRQRHRAQALQGRGRDAGHHDAGISWARSRKIPRTSRSASSVLDAGWALLRDAVVAG